ncbi:MAG: methyltransferase family protein [Candidatus Hermodarchaeota archaeon]
MQITGKTEWLNHLPDYKEKRLVLIPLRVIIVTIVTLTALYVLDFTPRYFPTINWLTMLEPFFPYLGSSIAIIGGLYLVHQTWYRKEKYLAEDKERAYQKTVKFTFTGIPMVFIGTLHAFLPVTKVPLNLISIPSPINPITSFLSTSIFQLIVQNLGTPFFDDFLIRFILSSFFFILGLTTAFRSINVFGIDNAALVYLYYPEESKIVDHKIYSIVRHPLYVSVLNFALSAMMSQFSLYSIGIFVIWIIAFAHHIFFVEEKELIERFGEDYLKYKETVPALLIRPKNWGKYLRFLLGQLK